MTSVAVQFPVSSLVIYCALHARHRPQTLCLLTAIIGFMLLQCQDRCTCYGTDHLHNVDEIRGYHHVFSTEFRGSLQILHVTVMF